VTEVVVEAREKADLSKLEMLIKRANELKTNIEALARAIESKYSADPRLGSVVKNLLKTMQPPEPPSDQLLSVSNSLEKYVSALEFGVKTLTTYAVTLDELYEDLEKLEREVAELVVWEELLRNLAPHLASEASRLASRAQRLLSQPPLDEPKRALDEVETFLKEVRSHNRVCRTVYTNRLNELLSTVSQLAKTLKRASKVQTPTDAGRLFAYDEALRKLEEKLEEASRRPLEVKLDLVAVKRELESIEREISVLAESALSAEEGSLARELERVARALDTRAVSFMSLVESLSRRSGLPLEKVCYLIYLLEKRGFVALEVRVKV